MNDDGSLQLVAPLLSPRHVFATTATPRFAPLGIGLNLVNLLPEKTAAEQEAEYGLPYRTGRTAVAAFGRWNRCSTAARPLMHEISGQWGCGGSQ